ncbi:MAG TPA: subclass B3 metallo-beta-lactamase [Terracidiphilus sp.]|nr:subclass B3 metallo-beta-lactamase [Terracidiphilus sp.]
MLSRILIFLLALAGTACAQTNPDWTQAFPPYRIIGNVYYVGSRDLASFLITTPQGNILINSNLASSPPQIEKSVEELGFKFSDTKILLISHGHYDHAAGSAQILKMTHAKYMIMDGDVSVIESGGKTDFHYAKSTDMYFPPAKVDRVLHDGDKVQLGGVILVARKTPGHTEGCTTWTLTVVDKGRPYNVVIVGSPNVNPGYKLVNNKTYPQIAQDYEQTFRVLKELPCDVFLGAHGSYYDMLAKYPRLKEGGVNPFVDPAGYKAYVADREQAFEEELKKQEGTANPAK